MRYLSVCSGIEAASVAWHPLGWTPVAFSEIEPFPSAVLDHRFPTVPNLGDFTKITPEKVDRIELLVGGTPCQAFSLAGLRRSLSDERGNLTLQFVRLAHELHATGSLRYALWENVPGVLSTKDNAFGCFLGGLVGSDAPLDLPTGFKRWPNLGMVAGPLCRVAWRVLDAQHFGVPQRRKRVFVVASFGAGDPTKILFEPEGVRGDFAASGKKRQDVAPTLSARTKGGGGLGTDFDLDGGLIASTGNVARCDTAGYGRLDYETETFVAFTCKDYGADAGATSPTLRAMGHSGSHPNAGGQVAVAFDLRGREGGAQFEGPHDTANIRAASGGSSRRNFATSRVRRLTPRECERLQGFPDDWTLVPLPLKSRQTRERWAVDGPRYKACGNSMAVPVMRWIGERIDCEDKLSQQEGAL